MPGALEELCQRLRMQRDGQDCFFDVIVHIAEGRGLRGMAGHELNDAKAKVHLSCDPDDKIKESAIHKKTSIPFFEWACKLAFKGQPTAFFTSFLTIECVNVGLFNSETKIGVLKIGILDVFLSRDHSFPMQWFALNDLDSDTPALPTGFLRLSVIINVQDALGAALDIIPEEERWRLEMLEVPRMHAFVTATGMYNLIVKIFKGSELKVTDKIWNSTDPFIRVTTPTGEMKTDPKYSDLNPTINQQIQVPIFEPTFRHLIMLELWDHPETLVATLPLSWKEILCNQEYYKDPRWYDLFSLPEQGSRELVVAMGERGVNYISKFLPTDWRPDYQDYTELKQKAFEEATEYCGRLLLSLQVENREGQGKDPSLALTDMKPKDCLLFQDTKQKLIFRIHVLRGQGLSVAPNSMFKAEVQIRIGRRSVTSKQVPCSVSDVCEWFQSLELDMEVPFDDAIWEWTSDMYEAGQVPEAFLENSLPPVWIKVYRTSAVPLSPKQLIGFYKCSVRDLLQLKDPPKEHPTLVKVGFDQNPTIVLNKTQSTRPFFFVPEKVPIDQVGFFRIEQNKFPGRNQTRASLDQHDACFANAKTETCFRFLHKVIIPSLSLRDLHKCLKLQGPVLGSVGCAVMTFNPDNTEEFRKLEAYPWPWPTAYEGCNNEGDGRGTLQCAALDPYLAMTCIELQRDGQCELGNEEIAGFLWVSVRLYLPSREQCVSAQRGPPILSPFTKYNELKIPTPLQLRCLEVFQLRVHVYQARDLPSRNPVGLASAYVEIKFYNTRRAKDKTAFRTQTIKWSNSPTWDRTLTVDKIEMPCLTWPGWDPEDDTDLSSPLEMYMYDDDLLSEANGKWTDNYKLLRFADRIEVQVKERYRGKDQLLGRCFIAPEECLHTQVDPEWRELFKGNAEQDEGAIFLSAQLLHQNDLFVGDAVPPLLPQKLDKDHAERADADAPPLKWGDGELVGGKVYPHWAMDRTCMPPSIQPSRYAAVDMRECVVQIQVLGLRNMCQTTDAWDGDDEAVKKLREVASKPGLDLQNPNFMETVNLKVLLPDEEEYSPDLEVIVFDDVGRDASSFLSDPLASLGLTSTKRTAVAWGSYPLASFYPKAAPEFGADEDEEDDDENALLRARKKELEVQFGELMEELVKAQALDPSFVKPLKQKYKMENKDGGTKGEVSRAFELLIEAPSDAEFIRKTEAYLTKNEGAGAEEAEEDAEDVDGGGKPKESLLEKMLWWKKKKEKQRLASGGEPEDGEEGDGDDTDEGEEEGRGKGERGEKTAESAGEHGKQKGGEAKNMTETLDATRDTMGEGIGGGVGACEPQRSLGGTGQGNTGNAAERAEKAEDAESMDHRSRTGGSQRVSSDGGRKADGKQRAGGSESDAGSASERGEGNGSEQGSKAWGTVRAVARKLQTVPSLQLSRRGGRETIAGEGFGNPFGEKEEGKDRANEENEDESGAEDARKVEGGEGNVGGYDEGDRGDDMEGEGREGDHANSQADTQPGGSDAGMEFRETSRRTDRGGVQGEEMPEEGQHGQGPGEDGDEEGGQEGALESDADSVKSGPQIDKGDKGECAIHRYPSSVSPTIGCSSPVDTEPADNQNDPEGQTHGAQRIGDGVALDEGTAQMQDVEPGDLGGVDHVNSDDDVEPDRQEVVDTPDGKPNAEWIAFRRHKPHKVALEKSDEWQELFEPTFDEILLFQGRVSDYKRREAEAVGTLKCQIHVYRKEDELPNGKAKNNPDEDPQLYEITRNHTSIQQGLERKQPFKRVNIYETYPATNVEVRAYCLKCFQVTPGGLGRKEDGVEFWRHILRARLGQYSDESDVANALNPTFFKVFQFKNCVLPGAGQLIISLCDAKLPSELLVPADIGVPEFWGEEVVQGKLLPGAHNVRFAKTIGCTVVDLEDRWFCETWQEEKYKPREVRDLMNEKGVSQGKLSLFIDILEQGKADDEPPFDIQMMGKTLPMELRCVVWNTFDTACKKSQTSDVKLGLELIGVGRGKETDCHNAVKKKAYGMFNYRLKWRCRYPNPNLAFLLRVQVWNAGLLSDTSIAEGVLPLQSLFKDCFERNLGKTSPDDMEEVVLTGDESKFELDRENRKYEFKWFDLVHPNHGFNPAKDTQAQIQLSISVLPRAKARAQPAALGPPDTRDGPSQLPKTGRPPQPANPILYPEECKAYLVYACKEFFRSCRTPCICLCCCLLMASILAAVVGIQMALGGAV